MDTVVCCIKNCVDTVTQVYPHLKPWMTMEVKQLLKERHTTFYSTAHGNLKRGTRKTQEDFRRTDDHLESINSRRHGWCFSTSAATHLTSELMGATLRWHKS